MSKPDPVGTPNGTEEQRKVLVQRLTSYLLLIEEIDGTMAAFNELTSWHKAGLVTDTEHRVVWRKFVMSSDRAVLP